MAGLKYDDGLLMFTKTLVGNIFAGNATDHALPVGMDALPGKITPNHALAQGT